MKMPWEAVIDRVGDLAGELITTDKERLEIDLEGRKLEAGLLQGQMRINEVSAQHSSVFVAGARPSVIWVGVAGLAYQFLVYPLLTWFWAVAQAAGWVPLDMGPPPMLNIESLMVLLTGVLGVSGLRTIDKRAHVDTKQIGN